MNPEIIKKPIYKKWWFWLVILIVIAAIGRKEDKDSKTISDNSISTSDTVKPLVIPDLQQKFLTIVVNAQVKAKEASNDMQKGAAKSERDQGICSIIKVLQIDQWVGKITKIDANSDGKGVVSIEIAKDVYLKTWNNAISDFSNQTLIEPGSTLFNLVSNLKRGAMVKFSGQFFDGISGECIQESSLTLDGKIIEPEFIFKFSSILPHS